MESLKPINLWWSFTQQIDHRRGVLLGYRADSDLNGPGTVLWDRIVNALMEPARAGRDPASSST